MKRLLKFLAVFALVLCCGIFVAMSGKNTTKSTFATYNVAFEDNDWYYVGDPEGPGCSPEPDDIACSIETDLPLDDGRIPKNAGGVDVLTSRPAP